MHDHDPRRRPGHGPRGPQREESTTAKPRPTSNAESHPPRSGLTDPGEAAPSDGSSRGEENQREGTAAETGTGTVTGTGTGTGQGTGTEAVPEDDFTRGGTATGAADPTTAIVPRTTTSVIDRWQAGTDLPTSAWLPALVAGGVVAVTVGVSTWTHLGGTQTATAAALLAGMVVIGASLLAINVGWRVGLPEDVLTGGR